MSDVPLKLPNKSDRYFKTDKHAYPLLKKGIHDVTDYNSLCGAVNERSLKIFAHCFSTSDRGIGHPLMGKRGQLPLDI